MRRRSFLRTAGGGSLVITTGLAGCTSRGASNETSKPVEGALVEMTEENVFEPADIAVSAGETVVWRNVGQGMNFVLEVRALFDQPFPAAHKCAALTKLFGWNVTLSDHAGSAKLRRPESRVVSPHSGQGACSHACLQRRSTPSSSGSGRNTIV